VRTRTRIALSFVRVALALAGLEAKGPPAPKTGVPRWDARGAGRLAWQGVACLDVNDDATRIDLGTIAPPDRTAAAGGCLGVRFAALDRVVRTSFPCVRGAPAGLILGDEPRGSVGCGGPRARRGG
jgi:hypothetical protein